VPYQVSWLLSDRIIYTSESAPLSEDDIMSFNQEILSYLEKAAVPCVHLVMNTEHVATMPPLTVMTRRFSFPRHPKLDWVVAISKQVNPAARVIAVAASQMRRRRYCEVESIEEALATLRRVDPGVALIRQDTPPT
jgi:hypothetical protein